MKKKICQEQIELSAFSVLEWRVILEQEVSGGCSLSSSVVLAEELSIAILPQLLRSIAENGCG